jgi:O-antigen ligase
VLLIGTTAPVPYPGSDSVVTAAVLAVVVAALSFPPPLRAPVPTLLPTVVVVLALCSAAWSAEPVLTLRGGAQLLLLAVGAWNAARVLTMSQLVSCAALAFRLLLGASLLLALVRPDIGLVQGAYEAGSLQGVFNHRNLMAFVASMAVIAFWCGRGRRARVWLVADLALALTCLVAARSQSSTVVVAVLVPAVVALAAARKFHGATRVLVSSVIVATAAGVALLAVHLLPLLLRGLGRDETFTGRTVIWRAVLRAANQNPVLGIGWDAAWHKGVVLTDEIWSDTGFAIYQAHNGYLDMYLQLGLVGLTLLVVMVLGVFARSVSLVLRDGGSAAAWPVLTIVAMLASNVTESRFATPMGWLLLCLAYSFCRRSGTATRDAVGTFGAARSTRPTPASGTYGRHPQRQRRVAPR